MSSLVARGNCKRTRLEVRDAVDDGGRVVHDGRTRDSAKVVNVGVSCKDTGHPDGGATSIDTYSCSLSAAGRRERDCRGLCGKSGCLCVYQA